MIDEPLVIPVAPGSALVRLTQVEGALSRHTNIGGKIPDGAAHLQKARQELLAALEADDRAQVKRALQAAQETLYGVYHALREDADSARLLGFPDLQQALQAVDVETVCTTFTKPERQVLTAIAFEDAAGATAYWLVEKRVLGDEILEDYLMEATAPLFPRLRLPIGPHRFCIQSRNLSEFVTSADFDLEVPAL